MNAHVRDIVRESERSDAADSSARQAPLIDTSSGRLSSRAMSCMSDRYFNPLIARPNTPDPRAIRVRDNTE